MSNRRKFCFSVVRMPFSTRFFAIRSLTFLSWYCNLKGFQVSPMGKETENLEQHYKLTRPNKTSYRIFHPIPAEQTFFSGAHGTFSRRNHMLSLNKFKTSLNKFKRAKNIQSVLSNHGIKLKIINRRKFGKFKNVWKLNNTL